MAPSAKALEEALIDGTCAVFKEEPDATTVNKVRKFVTDDLGLDEEFFNSPEWKQKSKTIIKETVEKLMDGWTPDPPAKKKGKNGVKKRHSSEEVDEEEPKPKRQKKTKAAKPTKKEISDDSEDEEKHTPKHTIARRGARQIADSGSEDEQSEEDKKDVKKGSPAEGSGEDVKKRESSEEVKPVKTEESKQDILNEEEEYSDVIDEEPAPKPKKAAKKEKPVKKEAKESKKPADPSADLSPHEAEIKKLQGQLTKCGVRKLWHNELKRYGDDSRAKIKHLRGMLADVGMEGRFSEQKAREIKEARELRAEVEAAEEMNKLWGTEGRTGRGVKRGKGKGVKMEESEEEDGEEGEEGGKDEESEEEEETFAARRRRAQADLAFLGDDSDSD